MSWTSEFELPPQGPQVDADTTPGDDDQPEAESPAEDSEPPASDEETTPEPATSALADIPDEGPLDPSVFDGLFDDLLEPDDEPPTPDLDSDSETDSDNNDAEQELDPAPGDDLALELIDGVASQNGAVLEAVDGEPSDTGEYAEPEQVDLSLEDLDGAFTIGDLIDDEAAAVEEVLDDEVFRPIDDDTDGSTDDPGDGVDPDLEFDDDSDFDFDDEAEFDDEFEADDELEADGELEAENLGDVEDPDLEFDADFEEADEFEVDADFEDGFADDDYSSTDISSDESPPNGDGAGEPTPPLAAPQLPVLDQSPSLFEPTPSTENGHHVTPEPLLVQHEQVPAVATSPPIALDEPGPALNGVADTPIHFDVPAAEVVDRYHPPAYEAPAKTRRWPSFVTAVVIGGGLGIGGAIALIALQEPETENSGATTPVVVADGDPTTPVVVDSGTAEPGTDDAEPADGGEPVDGFLSADGSLLLNSLGFVPGTVELTAQSEETLQQVAEALADLPPEPTVLAVRTFSEATAQANRDLSINQAEALSQYLANLGVEFGGLSVRGLGAAPLGVAMPVDNFVVVNPNLGADDLKRSLDGIGRFEIGIDPDTLQLRPESVATLDLVGVAMTAGQGTISLAGYSYDRPSDEANKAMARAAVEGAKDYLASAHQIDPARISVLAPGSLPYVVGQAHGGHVVVKRGRAAAVEVAIHSGDSSVLSFAPGSDALSGAASEELTRLAALLAEAETEAVISVRAAGEASAEANLRLSERQADAIGAFLLDAGLAAGQVRAYGVGDVTRHRSDASSSEVIVTVLG